MYFKSRFLML